MRRFFYVGSKDSNVAHICYSRTHVEGNLTACGRPVRAGWPWWHRASKSFRVCRHCEAR